MTDLPCKALTGRRRRICTGEAGIPADQRREYIEKWLREGRIPFDPDNPSRKPAVPYRPDASSRTGCRHRGPETRRVDCSTCGGRRVQHKVFSCAVHAECVLGPAAEGLPSCRSCADYAPALANSPSPRRVILEQLLAPGDAVVLSGALRALHDRFPGQYLTDVRTAGGRALWDHNPLITELPGDAGAERVTVHYGSRHDGPTAAARWADIDASNQRPVHFLHAMCEGLGRALGLEQPLAPTVYRGDLYLSDAERGWDSQIQEITGRRTRYWIVNAGRKSDFTCKAWPAEYFREVIRRTRDRIVWVQIGATDAGHVHPELPVQIDLRGKTDLRQLVRLVHHADGVLTGVSLPMHLAAAVPRPRWAADWPRPAIVVAGGREPVSWNVYPGQQLLHTIGTLDCCRSGGCWRSRVEPLHDGSEQDGSICSRPRDGYPQCMRQIGPDEVLRQLERYLD